MTVKQFFKSTTFKCIVTLLAILLVCGIFLTVMYGFLEVSDEERFDRAISKIYGKSVATEKIELADQKTKFEYSTVLEAYKVTDDGNYLIKVDGKEGFGGNVTCWVVVDMSDDGSAIDGIMKIVIDSAPGESYISNINQGHLDRLAAKAEYGKELMGGYIHDSTTLWGDDIVETGASYSMRAISNAVNGAMDFVAGYALGEVKTDFYGDNGFEYLDYISNGSTSYKVDGNLVTYKIVNSKSPASAFTIAIQVGEGGVVTKYKILVDGGTYDESEDADYKGAYYDESNYVGKGLSYFEGALNDAKDKINKDVIDTGASVSNFLCVYAGAFATANYEKCLATAYAGDAEAPASDIFGEEPDVPNVPDTPVTPSGNDYKEFINLEDTTFDKATRTFTIVTVAEFDSKKPNAFTITIKVSEDNKIESFVIDTNGSTADRYTERMLPSILDGSLFVGKNLVEIEALIKNGVLKDIVKNEDELSTGATQSNFICGYACAFALANIDEYLNAPSGNDYKEYIDVENTIFVKQTGTFMIKTLNKHDGKPGEFDIAVTVSSDATNGTTIKAFTILTNGSTRQTDINKMLASIKDGSLFVGKDLAGIEALIKNGVLADIVAGDELQTGATRSNFVCGYAAAFALANYDEYMAGEGYTSDAVTPTFYTEYIDVENTIYIKEFNTFIIRTLDKHSGKPAGFDILVAVSSDATNGTTIKAFTILTNGSTRQTDIDKMLATIKDGSLFVDKNLSEVEALIKNGTLADITTGDELKTGATRSNFVCGLAAAFALANYNIYAGGND